MNAAFANGTAIGDWTAGSATATAEGLATGTSYYFNVLVRDPVGNHAACASVSYSTHHMLPPMACDGSSGDCAQLVRFDPSDGPGWIDYPVNGETERNQYRSYLRRDLMMLIRYAAVKVANTAANWPIGNGGDIGLGDMSEANGRISTSPTTKPAWLITSYDRHVPT